MEYVLYQCNSDNPSSWYMLLCSVAMRDITWLWEAFSFACRVQRCSGICVGLAEAVHLASCYLIWLLEAVSELIYADVKLKIVGKNSGFYFILFLMEGYQSIFPFQSDWPWEWPENICTLIRCFSVSMTMHLHTSLPCRNIPNGAAVGASPKRCLMSRSNDLVKSIVQLLNWDLIPEWASTINYCWWPHCTYV